MQRRILSSLFLCAALAACAEDEVLQERKPLAISRIETAARPVEAEKPVPAFTDFFDEGAKVIYAYVWLENTGTLTGSFPVQATWFSPNDLSPPIVRHRIEMEPNQDIAQFSLHNDGGLKSAPYKLIVRAGENFTASGSKRVFVGMTEEAAQTFLQQEAEFLKAREEKRRQAAIRQAQAEEEERKKREAEEESDDALPPGLTDGVGEEG